MRPAGVLYVHLVSKRHYVRIPGQDRLKAIRIHLSLPANKEIGPFMGPFSSATW